MPLSSYEYSGTNIPAFLTKLWTLVEDKKYDELIAWDPTGYSFHVYDQTRFAREILPRFFKHNNMASFIRQLNMYGFRKLNSVEQGSLKSEKDDMEFHHPYFVKNKEHLLELIKRKVSSGASHQIKKEDCHEDVDSTISNNNKLNNNNNNNNINNINNQNQNNSSSSATTAASATKNTQLNTENLVAILQGVKSMHAKQADVVDRLQFLKRENEALWKEVSVLRQKHHHQQQIVNKLIHFLVHLVNPSTMGIKRTRPLMIDSHSTLTNINDNLLNENLNSISNNMNSTLNNNNLNLNSNTTSTNNNNNNKRNKIIEEDLDDFNDEPINKHARLSPFDHNFITKKIDSGKDSNNNENKGVIINDITDTLLKQPLNNSSSYEDCEIKTPLVDLVVDSPSTIQDDTNDASDFLNSSLFLNTDVQDDSNTIKSIDSLNKKNENIDNKNNVSSLLNNDNLAFSSKTQNPTKSNATSASSTATLSLPLTTTTIPPSATTSTANNILYLTTQPEQPGLKRTISSSQLLDHVETFQFDLNSIKDFLNTNHNVDSSVLNHLFTPAVEELESFQSSILFSKQNYDPNNQNILIIKNDDNNTGSTQSGNNELVHFENSINPELLFNMDEEFLPTQQNNISITSTSNVIDNNNEFLSTPPHIEKDTESSITTTTTNGTGFEDFILSDFTDSLLNDDKTQPTVSNNNNNNNHAKVPVARKTTSKRN